MNKIMKESAAQMLESSSAIKQEIRSVDIAGVAIHDITVRETLDFIMRMVHSRKPSHIMTVNPEFVMMGRRDTAFMEVLRNADLKVPDGIGILLGARMLGEHIRERVPGIDLVRRLAGIARDQRFRIFLLGAAPGVAEAAAAVLQRENPGLQIAGTYAGSPRPEEEDGICAMITRANPDILLVAYGPPKQDIWISRTQVRLHIPVAMGVGGTFDFIAGIVPRAPSWMRRCGLEWLFRLIRQPRRWKRQLDLPRFLFAVVRSRF